MSSSNNSSYLSLRRIQDLAKRPGNNVCAECPERNPNYISIVKALSVKENVGVFVCEGCYQHHFKLGMSFCETKPLSSQSEFSRSEVSILRNTGNTYVNTFLEANLLSNDLDDWENDKEIITFDKAEAARLRKQFVKRKYIGKKYFCYEAYNRVRSKRDGQAYTPDIQPAAASRKSSSRRATISSATKKPSALEKNCKEAQPKGGLEIPQTPRTMGRKKRATMASTAMAKQLATLPMNHNHNDCAFDPFGIHDDNDDDDDQDHSSGSTEHSDISLPAQEDKPSLRDLMGLGGLQQRSLGDRASSSRSLQTRPTKKATGGGTGLDTFLTLQDDKAPIQRKCQSVKGTSDTIKPKKLLSEKVYEGTVDVSLAELKAAKARKAARRRESKRLSASDRSSGRGGSPRGVRELEGSSSVRSDRPTRTRGESAKSSSSAALSSSRADGRPPRTRVRKSEYRK